MTDEQTVTFLDLGFTYRTLKPQIDAAVDRVLASGWYILGPEVEDFERAYAEFTGAEHCVGVANGLDALILVLRAWGIGAGDEVIVPSNTYIATWLAVTQVGARLVPVEPDEETFNLDPGRVAAAITSRTAAILPVHLYGLATDMDAILELGRAKKVRVLEDAAQAHGGRYRGRPIGGLGDATAWSFYPSKNLGAFGDAGAITTKDSELAARLRTLRNYGARAKYENELLGVNTRLDPLQAAVLQTKLSCLKQWNQQRVEQAARYRAGLADLHWLSLPRAPAWADPVWHVYVVRTVQRAQLQTHLARCGIQTLIHYPTPPHLQAAYAGLELRRGALPISERIHDEVLSLPIGPHLGSSQIDRVVDAVRRFEPRIDS